MSDTPPVPPTPPIPPSGATPGPPPPTSAARKGLPVLAWVGIGCGAIIVVGIIVTLVGGFFVAKKVKEVAGDMQDNPVKATAEFVIRANPELDLVESNDEDGTMTIKNNKTGEVATFDYTDIKEGRFRWTTDEGEVSIDASSAAAGEGGGITVTTPDGSSKYGSGDSVSLPNWVPDYPGSEPTSNLSSETADGSMSIVGFQTTDTAKDVLEFYRREMESEGLKILNHTLSSGAQGEGGVALAESADKKRTVNVLVTSRGRETDVRVQYNEKK